ncbi:MAG: zf-HC2 domain-containing protein [Idiomarina sp.]|nr:zf-HC2 domain-containing protein [Idiomarina sp.]
MNNLNPCESVQEKLSAYLDNELTQQEQQRMHVHIKNCPECTALLSELTALQSDVKGTLLEGIESMDSRSLQAIMQDKPARWLSAFGWGLLIIGALLLGGFFVWQFTTELLADNSVPWWVRFGILGFYCGLFLLFLGVLRQRLVARKTDKYKKVNI